MPPNWMEDTKYTENSNFDGKMYTFADDSASLASAMQQFIIKAGENGGNGRKMATNSLMTGAKYTENSNFEEKMYTFADGSASLASAMQQFSKKVRENGGNEEKWPPTV